MTFQEIPKKFQLPTRKKSWMPNTALNLLPWNFFGITLIRFIITLKLHIQNTFVKTLQIFRYNNVHFILFNRHTHKYLRSVNFRSLRPVSSPDHSRHLNYYNTNIDIIIIMMLMTMKISYMTKRQFFRMDTIKKDRWPHTCIPIKMVICTYT